MLRQRIAYHLAHLVGSEKSRQTVEPSPALVFSMIDQHGERGLLSPLAASGIIPLSLGIDAHKGRLDVQGGQQLIAMGTPEGIPPCVTEAVAAQSIQVEGR